MRKVVLNDAWFLNYIFISGKYLSYKSYSFFDDNATVLILTLFMYFYIQTCYCCLMCISQKCVISIFLLCFYECFSLMFINAEKAPLRKRNLNVNKLFSQFKVNKLRHYLRYIP